MQRILLAGSFIFFLVLPTTTLAQTTHDINEEEEIGEIVVTATRVETPVREIGSSVTVITSDEIESKQKTTVLEILRDVQGLDVVQSGGPGHTTSIFIRGGESKHTLVMIDGIQVNSPTLGSYDFSSLTIDNIERIEIIRGPQSTLYGSDAMAGVINIITKKGEDIVKFTAVAEAGSYNTFKESVSFSGSAEKLGYSLTASRFDTEGFSVLSEENGNTEDDGYENSTFSARFSYNASDDIDLDFTLRYTDAESELDGFNSDDPNFTKESEFLITSFNVNQILRNFWDHNLKLSLVKEDIENKDPDTSFNNSNIHTRIETVDWQHNVYLFDDINILTVGAEYEKQEGKNDSAGINQSIHSRALYIQEQVSLLNRDFNLTAGIRNDNHSTFGDKTTYRMAASYLMNATKTRIKGSWATGFKAPTLSDLFFQQPFFQGNPNLLPEESTGYDVGLEQDIFNSKIKASVTYFLNKYKNKIKWAPNESSIWVPENVDKAEAEGLEFYLEAKSSENLIVRGSYTISNTEDKSTGNDLARRPDKKGTLTIGWVTAKTNINLTTNYVGERWSDTSHAEKLDSYVKVDLAASYDLTKNLNLFCRVENLTDEKYEEVKDFGTPRFSVFGGLKLSY